MCALRLRARAVPLYFSSFAAAVVSMQITITKTIENAAKYFLQLLPFRRNWALRTAALTQMEEQDLLH